MTDPSQGPGTAQSAGGIEKIRTLDLDGTEKDLRELARLDECPACHEDFDGVMIVRNSIGRLDAACLCMGYVFLHDLPYEREVDDHITALECDYHLKHPTNLFVIESSAGDCLQSIGERNDRSQDTVTDQEVADVE